MAGFSISLLALFVGFVAFHQVVWAPPPDTPNTICLAEAQAVNSTSRCQVFQTCCETQCAGKNFTAACSEETGRLVANCVCKGGSSPPSTPGQCGKPSVPPKVPQKGRIVGGEPAMANSWPWQVSMHFNGAHDCGGSLLDPKHVLTAAHCVKGRKAADFKIIVGVHDQEAPASSYQTLKVKKIIEHENYVPPPGHSNDVAILVLESPAQFNKNVSSICLPAKDAPVGKFCIATGWGVTDPENPSAAQSLLQVTVPVLSTSECNDTDHYNGKIDETMFCAGMPGKDSCWGDSGGPLVCQRADNIWEVQGVVSWGIGCAEEKKPGVYAKVTHLKQWIQKNTKG